MPFSAAGIEIDGALHEDPEKDQRKTAYLEDRGWRVLRIPASETDQGLDDVIASIWQRVEEPTSPP